VPHVRISVQGSSLLLTGDPQAAAEAKILISQLDVPPLQPTVLSSSTQVAIDVVTTTNVSRVAIGTAAGTASTALTQVSPGKWQGTFAASQAGFSSSQPAQQLVLNAYRSDGFSATIQIPVRTREFEPKRT